ncbi:MAG: DUF4062 domain-containing protein [Thermoanaerobaculia bacterium]
MVRDNTIPEAIRVFVSSTFLDLNAEREILGKDVFPRIRKICEERGVAFSAIDLRSGIPEARIAAGELVGICLAEIDRCRPFFLAILGHRYGTIASVPETTLREYPWLARWARASVTEIEIRHAVLNDPAAARHALLYMQPTEATGKAAIEPAMKRLREEIKADPRLLPRVRPLCDLEQFAEEAFQDLKAVVDEFVPDTPADNRERELRLHEAFARVRRQLHSGRGQELRRLDEAANAGGRRIVVTGPAGIGKSALLAAWARRQQRLRPGGCVVSHFVGVSHYGADVPAMLRRVLTELLFRCDIYGTISHSPTPADLADWLRRASARRVIVIVDGIDALDLPEGRSKSFWLPVDSIPGATLVISSLPGADVERLVQHGWLRHEIGPLRAKAVSRAVRGLRQTHAKELSPEQVERIAATPAASTPRFLAMLLEEIRQAGFGPALAETLDRCLAAPDAVELFRVLLRRYERDFDRSRPGLVRTAMGALWASRHGIQEDELRRLIADGEASIPQSWWSPFFLAVEHGLAYRWGRLVLASAEHREAVRREFAPTPRDEFAHRYRLVWFAKNHAERGMRVREYLPQLVKLRDWTNLISLLSQPKEFEDLWAWDAAEVRSTWATIVRETGVSLAECYRPATLAPGSFGGPSCIWKLSILLADLGETDLALELRHWLVAHYNETGDVANVAAALDLVAALLRRKGLFAQALVTLREAEAIGRTVEDSSLILEALVNRAGVETDLGDLDAALATFARVETELRVHPNPRTLLVYHNGIGLVHMEKGNHDAALCAYQAAADLARDLGDFGAYQAALGNAAMVHDARGEEDRALALLDEQERVCRRIGHREGLVGALGNRGLVLLRQGRVEEAIVGHREELQIARAIGFLYGWKQGLGHLAQALATADLLKESVASWEELANLCTEHDDARGRRIGFQNAAALLQRLGRNLVSANQLSEACDALRRMRRYANETGDSAVVEAALHDLVSALAAAAAGAFESRRWIEAIDLYREQEGLCVGPRWEEARRVALENQGEALECWKDSAFDSADLGTRVAIAREYARIHGALGNTDAARAWSGILTKWLGSSGEEDEDGAA